MALVACAEGYGATDPFDRSGALAPPASAAGMSGAPHAMAGSSGAAAMVVAGAPASAPIGDPCLRGETEACTCEGGGDGQRTCVYDDASPLDGFLSECTRCRAPAADPAEQCSDGEKNGNETDTDCGGGVCDPCSEGQACAMTPDCADSACVDGICTAEMPEEPAAGAGGGDAGSGGSAGADAPDTGDGGGGGDTSDEPVRSCFGERYGTPCQRDCLLPGNTAKCGLLGICSCL